MVDMDINDLPNELLVVIASFCPGIEVGTLCQVSRRFNRCLQQHRYRMLLIYKVRARMMSNVIFLLQRHIYYHHCQDEINFAVGYTLDVHINSYEKYRKKKHQLIDGYSNVDFENITCYACKQRMSLNYYIYDTYVADENFVMRCCYKCFHGGIIAFYQQYGRLPNQKDDVPVFLSILAQAQTQPLPSIPLEITHCFEGLGGGVIHWGGM